MKKLLVIATFFVLGGCAGMSYAINTYSNVELKYIKMDDDEYRIFDRPDLGKLMVTSSIGSAMGQGVGKGLLLMSVDTTPPKPMFQSAARKFLNETGREQCKIVDGYLIIAPQYEFTYECPSKARRATS